MHDFPASKAARPDPDRRSLPMFRDEVRQARQHRLHGDVLLALPLSWQLIGYGLFAMLIAAAALLSFASYSRVEVVSGKIEPDLGSAAVVSSRPGVISKVVVKDGERVRAGAPLAIIQAEEIDQTGDAGSVRTLNALREQERQLDLRENAILESRKATDARFSAQTAGLAGQISALDSQIATQQNLIAIAQADFNRAQGIAERGYVSKRDLQTREEILLTRQQQLANLTQQRTEKTTSLAQARQEALEAGHNAASNAAQIVGDRAGITERRSGVEASRGYTLVAPIDGIVTAVTARVGLAVQTSTSVMTIVPSRARVEALLYVPTRAAGFIAVGDEVRLKIDAYSYERFGTVHGKILRFSSAAVSRSDSSGKEEPVYLVVVWIPKPYIDAYGASRKLRPDMTLTASIVTRRQTLLERVFEPLFAAGR